jgi:hypothetical protein
MQADNAVLLDKKFRKRIRRKKHLLRMKGEGGPEPILANL